MSTDAQFKLIGPRKRIMPPSSSASSLQTNYVDTAYAGLTTQQISAEEFRSVPACASSSLTKPGGIDQFYAPGRELPYALDDPRYAVWYEQEMERRRTYEEERRRYYNEYYMRTGQVRSQAQSGAPANESSITSQAVYGQNGFEALSTGVSSLRSNTLRASETASLESPRERYQDLPPAPPTPAVRDSQHQGRMYVDTGSGRMSPAVGIGERADYPDRLRQGPSLVVPRRETQPVAYKVYEDVTAGRSEQGWRDPAPVECTRTAIRKPAGGRTSLQNVPPSARGGELAYRESFRPSSQKSSEYPDSPSSFQSYRERSGSLLDELSPSHSRQILQSASTDVRSRSLQPFAPSHSQSPMSWAPPDPYSPVLGPSCVAPKGTVQSPSPVSFVDRRYSDGGRSRPDRADKLSERPVPQALPAISRRPSQAPPPMRSPRKLARVGVERERGVEDRRLSSDVERVSRPDSHSYQLPSPRITQLVVDRRPDSRSFRPPSPCESVRGGTSEYVPRRNSSQSSRDRVRRSRSPVSIHSLAGDDSNMRSVTPAGRRDTRESSRHDDHVSAAHESRDYHNSRAVHRSLRAEPSHSRSPHAHHHHHNSRPQSSSSSPRSAAFSRPSQPQRSASPHGFPSPRKVSQSRVSESPPYGFPSPRKASKLRRAESPHGFPSPRKAAQSSHSEPPHAFPSRRKGKRSESPYGFPSPKKDSQSQRAESPPHGFPSPKKAESPSAPSSPVVQFVPNKRKMKSLEVSIDNSQEQHKRRRNHEFREGLSAAEPTGDKVTVVYSGEADDSDVTLPATLPRLVIMSEISPNRKRRQKVMYMQS